MQQAVDLERLLDIVVGTAPDSGNSRFHIAVARDHNDRHIGVLALEHVQQLQPVQPRSLHPDIQENQTGPPTRDFVEAAVRVMGLARLIAFILQDAGDQFANIVFVIDDEDVECHYLCTAAW